MIGQNSIVNKFAYNINNIPSTVVLIGPCGSGKKTLLNTIASTINLKIINLPKNITDEVKTELYTYSNDAILCMDLTIGLQYKQIVSIQNSLLKFIEDIPSNYKLFVLVEDESYLLDTILNRCYIQKLEDYTKEELKLIACEYNMQSIMDYSDKELEYLNYPKDILLNISIETINKMTSLVDTIFSSISNANISNTLSIVKKINFDNNKDLYDLEIFLNIFNYKLVNILKDNYDKKYFDTFKLLKQLRYDIVRSNVNKVYLFEKFLLDIKYIL